MSRVFTDNPDFAREWLQELSGCRILSPAVQDKSILPLLDRLMPGRAVWEAEAVLPGTWPYLILVEHAPASQYDTLIDYARSHDDLPDGVLCLAGEGENFHGLRDRPWSALRGNLHLSAYLAPKQKLARGATGFVILSAVSVMQTIDALQGMSGRATVKWVNDILLNGAKVCGVLANLQTQGSLYSNAVLGIGLNVETTPKIAPTMFVPEVTALKTFVPGINRRRVFSDLARRLFENYQRLLAGQYDALLTFYRKRSVVLGRYVEIYHESANATERIAAGKVMELGENLELYLEGIASPITSGRLALLSPSRNDSTHGSPDLAGKAHARRRDHMGSNFRSRE